MALDRLSPVCYNQIMTGSNQSKAHETFRNLRQQRKQSTKWVPKDEAKRDLCVGEKKLNKLLRNNVIPNIPIGGGVRLIPRRAYERWLESGNSAA
jgi:hypothetical protein